MGIHRIIDRAKIMVEDTYILVEISQGGTMETNSTVQSILNHRSVRDFSTMPLDDADLDMILACAQASPSSINGQQMSVIAVRDQGIKQKLAELAGGQRWIAEAPVFLVFVADFYRTKLAADKTGLPLVAAESMEGTLVGAVDVGIALGQTIAAAESLGLGTVCIGSVRRNPAEVIELLELPEYTYPMVGLCLGYPDPDKIQPQKPRFPKEAVIHRDTYNKELKPYVDAFDETIADYMKVRGESEDIHGWSDYVMSIYQHDYFPHVGPTVRSQGFKSK